MNYTLRQIAVFTKICELESITKAADALHMTQPAASIQLKNFQQQFKIPLTEVIGRKLHVTDFGKEIYLACTSMLEEAEKIEQSAFAYEGYLVGQLKTSIVSTAKYIMPYFLTDFLAQHPGIELTMDVTNKTNVIDTLNRNAIDFSLVSVMPEGLALDNIELMRNELYLVGGRNAVTVTKPQEPEFIVDLPLIYREEGSGTRQTMERFLEKEKLNPRKRLTLTSNEATKQAVIAGLGYSIMPLIGIKNEINRGDLKIIPIKGFPIVSSWNLVWLKNKRFLPPAEAFLEYIRKNKDEITERHFAWLKDDLPIPKM